MVVITQGTDARRHFPAAVAGAIYRGLNHRFGTAINLQIATTLDDEEKEVADAEAEAEKKADAELDESTNGDTTATAAPATTTTTPAAAPTPAKTATPEPRNTVKRVLMPLEKKPVETPKGAAGEQRPRRIQP